MQASWFDHVWHHATVRQWPVPISLISRGGSRLVTSGLGMFLRCLNGLPLRCSVALSIPCPSIQRLNPDPAKHPPPHVSLHRLAWQDINSLRCWGSSVALAVACWLRGVLGPAWSPRGQSERGAHSVHQEEIIPGQTISRAVSGWSLAPDPAIRNPSPHSSAAGKVYESGSTTRATLIIVITTVITMIVIITCYCSCFDDDDDDDHY